MNELPHYINLQIKKDFSKHRRQLFDYYIKGKLLLSFSYSIIERFSLFHFPILFTFAFWKSCIISNPKRHIGVFIRDGERKALEAKFKNIPMVDATKNRKIINFFKLLPSLFDFLNLNKLLAKYPLYVKLRCAETHGNYLLNLNIEKFVDEIYISSESEPLALALFYLRKKNGLKINFICHSYEIIDPSPIECDKAFLTGKRVYQDFLNSGGSFKEVEYLKVPKKEIKILDKKKCVLIALSKNFNVNGLESLLGILNNGPCKVILRLHPSSLNSDLINYKSYKNISFEHSLSLESDLNNSFVCFSGQSNVLIDSLIFGLPSIFLRTLDSDNLIHYNFLKDDLVYTTPKIEDLNNALDKSLIFYSRPSWLMNMESLIAFK